MHKEISKNLSKNAIDEFIEIFRKRGVQIDEEKAFMMTQKVLGLYKMVVINALDNNSQ